MTTATANKDKAATEPTGEEVAAYPESIIQLMALVRREAGALAPVKKDGIAFPFRGIDGTINHLEPLLDKYGIVTIPTVIDQETTEREVGGKVVNGQTTGVRVVKTTRVTVRFDFYAPNGSSIAATTIGLADDFADRSAAQAQSVAFRVALLQSFTLPTQSPEPEQTGGLVESERAQAGTLPAKKPTQVDALRAEILAVIKDENNPYTGDLVNEVGDSVTGMDRKQWFNDAKALQKVVEALRNGVTV